MATDVQAQRHLGEENGETHTRVMSIEDRLVRMRGLEQALLAVAVTTEAPAIWQVTWHRFSGGAFTDGRIDWNLKIHTYRHVAVCMALHSRLGSKSGLRVLDVGLLHIILQETASIQLTAASMLATFERSRRESKKRKPTRVPRKLESA
mmetsp:Transcript_16190/g.25857  ORF Transcript_16190/g.25857 Transcript_16190/m.25857 type:complete len:149 (+) Transcript_16190:65-511(+)